MTVEAIGYGAGGRDFPDRANLLRLFVGESTTLPESDEVIQLETNLDDVSPEVIGYTKQKLFEAGRGGSLHDADPDEKESPRCAAERPLPTV